MKIVFKNGYADGWKMCVPECFKDAIEKNDFSPGDIFYDTPLAYSLPWKEALKHIKLSIQVNAANGMTVAFDILTPNNERTGIVKTGNQSLKIDQFVDALRNGF